MNAWMFPGQGAQRAGMANDLTGAKDLFQEAGEILKTDLYGLASSEDTKSFPPDVLQPSIMVASVAAGQAITSRGLQPEAVVGHSLGEYAALVTAGAIKFADAVRLVDVRGKAMADAGRRYPGGMAAIIGLDEATVDDICGDIKEAWVANVNSADQTVISGSDKGLAQAASACVQAGAGRVVRLDVPVAAHSPLMEAAAKKIRKLLKDVEIVEPKNIFYSVVDAKKHFKPKQIRKLLGEAILSKVRFAETLRAMEKDGLKRFIEVGPGRALRGLAKRTLPLADVTSVSNDEDAETLAAAGASS